MSIVTFNITMRKKMGKGSKRRPREISDKEFEDNWDKVFGEKAKQRKKHTKQDRRWYDQKGEIE